MKHLATWIDKDRGKHFDELFHGTDFRLWNAREELVPWDEVGGLLLTGGADISATYLKQDVSNPALIRNPDSERDAWEFPAVHRALSSDLPVFALCRGHQVLNVALGGTLHLDIPGHNLPAQKYGNIQELRFAPTAEWQIPSVNSSHHQAINQPGDGLTIEAWSIGDDIVEQVRLRNYPFCLGVQFHPERDVIYRPLFDAFFAHVH